MDPKRISLWSGVALILGGVGACALGVFAPPAAVAGGSLIVAGLSAFTAGTGVLAASQTGGAGK